MGSPSQRSWQLCLRQIEMSLGDGERMIINLSLCWLAMNMDMVMVPNWNWPPPSLPGSLLPAKCPALFFQLVFCAVLVFVFQWGALYPRSYLASPPFSLITLHFYRTRVRSLVMLVTHSLTDSVTHCCLVNLTPVNIAVLTRVWSLAILVTHSLPNSC